MRLPTRRARSAVLALLIGCRHPAHPPHPDPFPGIHAGVGEGLAAPLPLDPETRGASYLTAIALQLQPPWSQFLEDCRLRLLPSHPLNDLTLVASVELAIDRSGVFTIANLAASASPDFDKAVRGVLGDARLAPPPEALLGDDDRAHVRWLFARDRRQAGPATAAWIEVALPTGDVVDRLLAHGELARAARRVAQGPLDGPAAERVMVAVLREALDGANNPTRELAIAAIGRAHVTALAASVRERIHATIAAELRRAATEAAGMLGDRDAAPAILVALPGDLDEPRLAIADVIALAALGRRDAAAAAVAAALDDKDPARRLGALHAFAHAPTAALATTIAHRFERADARTRAASCTALAEQPAGGAMLARGLTDPDATVRAVCVAAVATRHPVDAGVVARLKMLAHDRDRVVRAQAVGALVALAPGSPPVLGDEDAPEVRAAFAAAHPRNADPTLRALAADRDADVRAAALGALGDRAPELAVRGAADVAPQVRLAAVAALDDDAALDRLAGDAAEEVATAAAIKLAGRRGRAATLAPTVAHVIAAAPASAARVRLALAWLLAR